MLSRTSSLPLGRPFGWWPQALLEYLLGTRHKGYFRNLSHRVICLPEAAIRFFFCILGIWVSEGLNGLFKITAKEVMEPRFKPKSDLLNGVSHSFVHSFIQHYTTLTLCQTRGSLVSTQTWSLTAWSLQSNGREGRLSSYHTKKNDIAAVMWALEERSVVLWEPVLGIWPWHRGDKRCCQESNAWAEMGYEQRWWPGPGRWIGALQEEKTTRFYGRKKEWGCERLTPAIGYIGNGDKQRGVERCIRREEAGHIRFSR